MHGMLRRVNFIHKQRRQYSKTDVGILFDFRECRNGKKTNRTIRSIKQIAQRGRWLLSFLSMPHIHWRGVSPHSHFVCVRYFCVQYGLIFDRSFPFEAALFALRLSPAIQTLCAQFAFFALFHLTVLRYSLDLIRKVYENISHAHRHQTHTNSTLTMINEFSHRAWATGHAMGGFCTLAKKQTNYFLFGSIA